MDHIPRAGGAHLDITVPYLKHELKYDGLGWAAFPQRAGYPWLSSRYLTVQQLERNALAHPERDLQAFVQTWLYWGVLQEVLQDDYSESDFLESDLDGAVSISTKCVQSWIRSFKVDPPSQVGLHDRARARILSALALRQDRMTRIPVVLEHALMMSNLLDTFARDRDPSWAILVLSIKILIELLSSRALYYTDGAIRDVCWPTQPGPALEIIRSHLLKNSKVWCIHQLDHLCAKVSYSTMIYLTGIRRYERPGVDHVRCTGLSSCGEYNIPVGATFERIHTTPDCRCADVQAPSDERTQILQAGGIPVLSCARKDNGLFDLHFQPASPATSYVAISHMWTDGLGNPFQNSLPSCQLHQLVDTVERAKARSVTARPDGPPLIWLDVYCIPAQQLEAALNRGTKFDPGSECVTALKQEAIARMDATYSWAEFVLVLDQEIMHTISSDSYEVSARVGISAWNTRCWTFQEYSLAKKTIFLGENELFERPEQNCRSGSTSEPIRFLNPLRRLELDMVDLCSPFDSATGLSSPGPARPRESFANAWNSFHGRSTTKWEDMITVLANLLDLSAGYVLRLDTALQMKAILRSQSHLPMSLLFAQMSRRSDLLAEQGRCSLADRWIPNAPQSVFLTSVEEGYDMTVTSDGLLLDMSSLARPEQATHICLISISFEDSLPRFFWLPMLHGKPRLCWFSLDEHSLRHCLTQTSSSQPRRVVLLLDMMHPMHGRDSSASFAGALLLSDGASAPAPEPFIFVSPISWGFVTNEYQLYTVADAVLLTSEHPSILIASDIESWPTLPRSRRHRADNFQRWRTFFAWYLYTNLCIYLTIVLVFTTIIAKLEETDLMYKCSAILAIWLTPLTIPLMLAMVMRTMFLLLSYSTMSEVNVEIAWWRQLDIVFRIMGSKDTPWFWIVPHFVLRGVVWCVKVTVDMLPQMCLKRRKADKRRKWRDKSGESDIDMTGEV